MSNWFQRRLVLAVGLGVLSAAGARGDTVPVIACPWYSATAGDDFARRGFMSGYGGRATTLKQVTLILSFPAPGAYSLSLTVRRGTFDGPVLGTAMANVNAAGTDYQQVTFDLGTITMPAPEIFLTFQGAVTSKPNGVTGAVLMETTTDTQCPVFETADFSPPLSTWRHGGIAVTMTGDVTPTFRHIVTVPANASIHGVNGTFFHTDAWIYNASSSAVSVTATYHCFQGQSCGAGTATFPVSAGQGVTFPDVVGTLFGAPESAGAISYDYEGAGDNNQLLVLTRTYTPSLPSPTNGASLSGMIFINSTGARHFVGLGNNGGDRSSGFRTNAGVYNPWNQTATVTFTLQTKDGTAIGQPVTQDWGPNEARQVNDIFAVAGAGGVVTTDAVLKVTSTLSVFPYVTVIDNVTGDSVIEE